MSHSAHSQDPCTSVSCLSEVTVGICNQVEVVPKEPDFLGSDRTLNFLPDLQVGFVELSVNEVRKMRSQKRGGGRNEIWKLSHTSDRGDHRSKAAPTQLTVACSSFFQEELQGPQLCGSCLR